MPAQAFITPESSLTLQEAIARLESGEIVSMSVIKYDAQRKTGGDIMEILQCRYAQMDNDGQIAGSKATFAAEPMDDDVRDPDGILDENDKRDPKHFTHFTRNVVLYSAGQKTSRMTKIHPLLILKMDGLTVI